MKIKQKKNLLRYKKYAKERIVSFVKDKVLGEISVQTNIVEKQEEANDSPSCIIEDVGVVNNKKFVSDKTKRFLYLFLKQKISSISLADLPFQTDNHFIGIGTVSEKGEKGECVSNIFVYDLKKKKVQIKHSFGDCQQIFFEMKEDLFLFFCLFSDGKVHLFTLSEKTKLFCELKKTFEIETSSKIVCFSIDKERKELIGTCHEDGSICLWKLENVLKTKKAEKVFFDLEPCSVPTSCTWNKENFFVSKRNGKVVCYSLNKKERSILCLNRNVFYKLSWDLFDDSLMFCEETNVGFIKENCLKKNNFMCNKNNIITDFSVSTIYPLYAVGGIDGTCRISCFRREKSNSFFEVKVDQIKDSFSVKLIKKQKDKKEEFQTEPTNMITDMEWNNKEKDLFLVIGYNSGLVLIIKEF